MIKLRPYQEELIKEVEAQFSRAARVLLTLPTGGGKTVALRPQYRAMRWAVKRELAIKRSGRLELITSH